MARAGHTPQEAVTLAAQLYSDYRTEAADLIEELLTEALAADPNHPVILGNYAIFLTTIRADHDQAQHYYERALKSDPNNATFLGNYANFLTTIRTDYDQAQNYYKRALKSDPNNARNLGNYAIFLTTIRTDYDQAQNYYKRTLKSDPNHPVILGAYALFLESVHKDHDQAQHYFERALKSDPNHPVILGAYALFLESVHKDHDQAQHYFERALKSDPNHTGNLGNYAQLLFITGHDIQAIEIAERAISLAGPGEDPLLAKCHAYLFMHSHEHRRSSGQALASLLAQGVTTGDWSFEGNLERLRREEDPRLPLAEALARAVESGQTTELQAFDEWRQL